MWRVEAGDQVAVDLLGRIGHGHVDDADLPLLAAEDAMVIDTTTMEVVQTVDDVEIKCDLWVKIGRWYGEKLVSAENQTAAIAKFAAAMPVSYSHLAGISL